MNAHYIRIQSGVCGPIRSSQCFGTEFYGTFHEKSYENEESWSFVKPKWNLKTTLHPLHPLRMRRPFLRHLFNHKTAHTWTIHTPSWVKRWLYTHTRKACMAANQSVNFNETPHRSPLSLYSVVFKRRWEVKEVVASTDLCKSNYSIRGEKSAKGSLLCVDLIRLNPLGNKIKSYVKV